MRPSPKPSCELGCQHCLQRGGSKREAVTYVDVGHVLGADTTFVGDGCVVLRGAGEVGRFPGCWGWGFGGGQS